MSERDIIRRLLMLYNEMSLPPTQWREKYNAEHPAGKIEHAEDIAGIETFRRGWIRGWILNLVDDIEKGANK